jgi:hypothetical protein
MADPVPFKRPVNWQRLRPDDAERIIRQRSQDPANIVLTVHAEERMGERDIPVPEVHRILRTGTVEGVPERDGAAWKVTIMRRIPDRREAGVVTAIVQNDKKVVVITVEWMDLLR